MWELVFNVNTGYLDFHEYVMRFPSRSEAYRMRSTIMRKGAYVECTIAGRKCMGHCIINQDSIFNLHIRKL